MTRAPSLTPHTVDLDQRYHLSIFPDRAGDDAVIVNLDALARELRARDSLRGALLNADATVGELAWVWGVRHALSEVAMILLPHPMLHATLLDTFAPGSPMLHLYRVYHSLPFPASRGAASPF